MILWLSDGNPEYLTSSPTPTKNNKKNLPQDMTDKKDYNDLHNVWEGGARIGF